MKNTIIAYREGSTFSLEPTSPDAEPVMLTLAPGIRILSSGYGGGRLFYKDQQVYGRRLEEAMSLGWCWVEETSREGQAGESR